MSYDRGHNNYGNRLDGSPRGGRGGQRGGGPDRRDRQSHHYNKPYDNRRGGGGGGGGGYRGDRRGGFQDNRISDEVKVEVEVLFNKSYVFTETEGFTLPDHKTWFTQPPYQVNTSQVLVNIK